MEIIWKLIAKVVAKPKIADWLIQRAKRTEYFHLEGYMDRWWLFNPYGNDQSLPDGKRHKAKYSWLPSVRIHHILREDYARDMHDHPWDARTIILKGSYYEDRLFQHKAHPSILKTEEYHRKAGDTATLKFGEYHNITSVSRGGVWTMFITWKYQGTWGFFVNGRKVPHYDYTDGGAA